MTAQKPARQSTRLEAFTDAAFAFSLTLLVIAGDNVPGSFDEFILALKSIPAFIASAALLLMFWYSHMRWSQRYCLCDMPTILLTAALVCTVLVFVYPLRIVFGSLFHWISGGFLTLPMSGIGMAAMNTLFVIYAIGFLAMCIWQALLYHHALRKAEQLQLDAIEQLEARLERNSFLLQTLPALLSLLYLAVLPARFGPYSGFLYSLLGIIMPLYGFMASRQLASAQDRVGAQSN